MWVQREVVRYKRTNTFWKLPSGKQSNGILLVYFITAVNKPGGTQPTFVRGDWNDVEYPPQLQSEIWPTRSQRSFESLALASWSAERVTTGEAGAHPSKKRPFSPTDPVRHPPRRATPFYRAAFLVLRLHRASPFNIMSAWPCLALQKPPLLPQAPTRWQLPVTPPRPDRRQGSGPAGSEQAGSGWGSPARPGHRPALRRRKEGRGGVCVGGWNYWNTSREASSPQGKGVRSGRGYQGSRRPTAGWGRRRRQAATPTPAPAARSPGRAAMLAAVEAPLAASSFPRVPAARRRGLEPSGRRSARRAGPAPGGGPGPRSQKPRPGP